VAKPDLQAVGRDADLQPGAATEAFIGNRVTCARCHNHPLEKWTQKQYYENGNEPGDIVV
jgi:hypothetical protein